MRADQKIASWVAEADVCVHLQQKRLLYVQFRPHSVGLARGMLRARNSLGTACFEKGAATPAVAGWILAWDLAQKCRTHLDNSLPVQSKPPAA